MLKKIPKIAVYVVLFLVPLFTLPFTSNALDFQKQFLLFVVVSVGLFFWIWNVLSEKKLDINLNPLHFFVAGFAAVVLISSIFSLYSYGSLWGAPLPVAESFVTALSFVFLYFLIVNNFKKEESYGLIATVSISAAIAAVYGILQAWGVYLMPFFSYAKDPSFNTIGTANSLSLFAAIILATIFPLLFVSRNPYRRLMAICGGVLFFALLFFNGVITYYFSASASGSYNLSLAPWIVMAVSALATFVFSVSDQKFLNKNSRAKSASFAAMFIALLFLVFNIFAKDMVAGVYGSSAKALKVSSSAEVALSQRAAADIAVDVLKQSSQAFFLGSGPGTFVYDYVKFKPQAMSQDNVAWNITFYSGASEIINRIATTGLLGIVALLLIVALWTAQAFRTLTGEDDEDEGLSLAVFGGWLAVAAAMFFYPFNFSLAMIFWLFMALIIVMDEENMVSLPLRSVRLTYAVTLVFVAVLVLELGLLVWTAKRYYAETRYLSAVNALQKNDIVGAINDLESAANSTDRLQDNYLTGLSQIYLAQAREELNKQGAKPEDAMKAASPYIQTAVTAAMLSTNTANPNNSSNWATRGYVYRQLIGISDGFDTWAVDMYKKAIALEPNNPSLWTELGQVYIVKKDLDNAKTSFNKAIALRPQYVDPHYYLALIDDQQGDKAAAISELQIVSQLLPASDQTSIDNVNKAIDNLKQGKPLSGQAEERSQIGNTAPVESGQIETPTDLNAATGTLPSETVPAKSFTPSESSGNAPAKP